jgi:hypothetical protein
MCHFVLCGIIGSFSGTPLNDPIDFGVFGCINPLITEGIFRKFQKVI